MDIGVPLRHLGSVDCADLTAAVKALEPDTWDRCDLRQKQFEVHRQTKSIVMIFVDLDKWPKIRILKMPGWEVLSDTAWPVIQRVLMAHYPPGGNVIRAMVANLIPGGKIDDHYDSHPSFAVGHRIHVPLTTNEKVKFLIDDQPYYLKAGEGYEVNNLKYHSVENGSDEDRFHLIFDYVHPDALRAAAANPS